MRAPRARTPRSDMHRCSASITTPTPARVQVVLQPVGDLLGEPLLHLQVAGEQVEHAGELRQAEDPLARQVADVRDPAERQQVVLAERLHRDAGGQDQLVVALVVGERGQVERRRGEELGVGVGDPAGVSARCGSAGSRPSARSRAATACSAAGRSTVGAAAHDAESRGLGRRAQRIGGGHASVADPARRGVHGGQPGRGRRRPRTARSRAGRCRRSPGWSAGSR